MSYALMMRHRPADWSDERTAYEVLRAIREHVHAHMVAEQAWGLPADPWRYTSETQLLPILR